LVEPQRPGIRIDSALEAGKPILTWYDPMLAKLIATGFNRKEALMKMDALLRDYVLLGVRHNLDFLRYTIDSKVFQSGHYHTHSVAEILESYLESRGKDKPAPDLAYAVAALAGRSMTPTLSDASGTREISPLSNLGGFKNA